MVLTTLANTDQHHIILLINFNEHEKSLKKKTHSIDIDYIHSMGSFFGGEAQRHKFIL